MNIKDQEKFDYSDLYISPEAIQDIRDWCNYTEEVVNVKYENISNEKEINL